MKENSYILYKKNLLNFFKKRSREGFTLAELIVSSTISLTILLAGYYFTNIITQLNKNDSSQIKLFSKLDSAVDFILDEINSGKEILINRSQINSNCINSNNEFLFGLELPNQIKNNANLEFDGDDYLNTDNFINMDCPIVYSLVEDTKNNANKTYKLIRKGPAIDVNGFYKSGSYKDSLITDKVSQNINEISLICLSEEWEKIQIKGIELCVDKFRNAAEISITAVQNPSNTNARFITKTSGALNRIEEKFIVGRTSNSYQENILSSSNVCLREPCNFGPIPLTGGINEKSIVFLLDLSGSMSRISRDSRIQGVSRLQKAKIDLINAISNLKKDVKFQIISFGNRDQLMFKKGPQNASFSNKFYAYRWILTRVASQPQTLPSNSIMNSIFDKDIGQIIIISDGQISSKESCPYKSSEFTIDECATQYNLIERSNQDIGNNILEDNSVTIDSVSIGGNYCNTFSKEDNWMGKISKQNGGRCSVLR